MIFLFIILIFIDLLNNKFSIDLSFKKFRASIESLFFSLNVSDSILLMLCFSFTKVSFACRLMIFYLRLSIMLFL